ncbi:molybdopterin dinucleotide binding domain-containing protein [Acidiferrobacter thiooxydans]|uniref:Molybdopterin dinucleotide-binding domain-containing protein n=1 Tax=Acidiferrobacter thiooxydans TaxID=163359 RepID=A0A368HFS9_9GAMM|nr:hypothetical protein C4900_10865 [Acidiferrobacter thiooxydans]UEN98948.1 hypothetical protein A9R16_010995 [Acidiferrobacter thiooxydans]
MTNGGALFKDRDPFAHITYKQPVHSKSCTWADQWLVKLMPEPFAEMNSFDARNLGVKDSDWVIIRSARPIPRDIRPRCRLCPPCGPAWCRFQRRSATGLTIPATGL